MTAGCEEVCGTLKQLQAELEKSKKNLKIYGRHHNNCKISKEKILNAQRVASTSKVYCTCGFEQALSKEK